MTAAPFRAGLAVTGTDTGIGKTAVSRGLLARLRGDDLVVAAFKAVESGCAPGADGAPVPADALSLWEAAGRRGPPEAACGLALEEPLSPALAARRAGVEIGPRDLAARARVAGAGADLLLVEGAGGLLAPLWDGGDLADLARDLGLALLVVAGNRLGVQNHALLTVRTARAAGLRVAGVVLNEVAAPDPADLARATNAGELARLLGGPGASEAPFLGTVPWIAGAGTEDLAGAMPTALLAAVRSLSE
ncbi:dethiobiotin synthase [Myxococcota bacterium]|nr:dethiobiotin synthase [Myxococcota bacterium]